MNKRIKLGVIGLGMAWERLHYPALLKLTDQYEIAAVCNRTVEKAVNFANSIALGQENVYSDYREMLKRPDLEAIDVMVPISDNYNIAKDVIIAGKHLIAEKPFASTPEAAKELIDLKNQHNVKVLVGENFRYDEENNIIKEIISSGQIGEVMYFIQNSTGGFDKAMKENEFAAKEWRQYPDFPGGSFLDGGIHDMARMRFLFGDVASLYACARPQDEQYCPYMTINTMLKFKNNVIGHYSYYAKGEEHLKPPVGLRIYGTKGDLFMESKDIGVLNICYNDGHCEEKGFAPAMGYYYELLNFYNALTNNEAILSTPEEEYGDITLVYDVLKSIEQNQLIQMG